MLGMKNGDDPKLETLTGTKTGEYREYWGLPVPTVGSDTGDAGDTGERAGAVPEPRQKKFKEKKNTREKRKR